jgi:cytoskeleton protein RodZ
MDNARSDSPRIDNPAPVTSALNQTAAKGDGAETARGQLAAAGSAAAPPMVIDFRGTSWVQVKDGTGAILLSLTGNPGTTQVVSGTPPFDVVIGNIDAVTVSFGGRPVDLSMYSKQNVARMTLK